MEESAAARQWAVVRDLLGRALALSPPERAQLLDRECSTPAVRREIESLILAADRSAFFDQPAGVNASLAAAAENSAADLTGQTLSHYRITGPIGSGGMGTVYRAVDVNLDRAVALKVISEVGTRPQQRLRFEREAKAASALQHPNIVTIYEYNSAAGVDFIAMELADGQPLDEILRTSPAGLPQALAWARQLARGLAHAHAAGVVHRDLKPANIFITRAGSQLKILDFGLAKEVSHAQADGLTRPGTILGTPAYMSPEQALGEATDARTDIFSFGVILYELVTGQRAFQGAHAVATLQAVIHAEPTPARQLRPDLPQPIADLIDHCLRKNRDERLASLAGLDTVLDAVPGVLPEARPVSASRRKALGAAVAAGAAGLASAYFWRQPAPRYSVTYTLSARQGDGDASPARVTDVFEAGWSFQLLFQAAEPGLVYLLNDGPGADGAPRLFLLAALGLRPDQLVSSGWMVFDQNPGVEHVWLVVARQPLPWLSELARGVIHDPARAQQIRNNLAAMRSQPRTIEPRAEGVMMSGVAAGFAELVQLQHR